MTIFQDNLISGDFPLMTASGGASEFVISMTQIA